MANPENLKPWKKGQSGNPRGTSKAKAAADRDVLEVYRAATPAIAVRLVTLALDPETPPDLAFRIGQAITDRVHGRAKQTVDVLGDGVSYVMRLPAPAVSAAVWEQEAQAMQARLNDGYSNGHALQPADPRQPVQFTQPGPRRPGRG